MAKPVPSTPPHIQASLADGQPSLGAGNAATPESIAQAHERLRALARQLGARAAEAAIGTGPTSAKILRKG